MDLSILVSEWGQRNSMEEKNITYLDSDGREVNLNQSDFELVQNNKKITDVKLHGKPTTFFKDAMKRFAKSKSAVVGGIIVGMLVLGAIIFPTFTPDEGVYDVSNKGGGTAAEAGLSPKLFDAGFGFWDGTVKRERVLYDNEAKAPVNYKEDTYFNVVVYERIEENVYSEYAKGGFVNVFCSNADDPSNYFSPVINFTSTENYQLSYKLSNEDYEVYQFVGYKLGIKSGDQMYYLVGDSSSYSTVLENNFSIKEQFVANGYSISEFPTSGSLYFEVSPSEDDEKSGNLLIEKVNISSSKEEENELLSRISFNDGNEAMVRERDEATGWDGDFGLSAHKVLFTYCDFTFDQYANAYGKYRTTYGPRQLSIDVENGGVEVDFAHHGTNATNDLEVLKERYKVIDQTKTALAEVVEQIGDAVYNPATGKYSGFTLTVKLWKYRELGYETMPRFFLGTNTKCQDYMKLLFTGMRFSFLLAIGISAVNIIIGLIWGSISGYFGGWTDIIMERICDILAGLPTTVIITLCILYGREFNWGNSADVIALMIALFMTGWMGVSARTRTQFYRYKGREYVLASRTLGAKDARLIFKHILPNSAGTIITGSILMIPSVIYTEASIAYLGLGLKNQILFGVVLANNNNYYKGDLAYLLFIPTFIMMLLLVSFNLFGNGLRDAFNPQLKGSE